MRRKTHEQFEREVYELHGNEYTVMGKYEGARKHLDFRHNTCGHIYKVMPTNVLKGYGCPECKRKTIGNAFRKNVDKFRLQLTEKYNGRITLSGMYTNARTKTTFYCNECNSRFETTPDAILRSYVKHGCPKCANKITSLSLTKNEETFDKELKVKYNGRIIRLTPYKTHFGKITVFCSGCRMKYETTPSTLLSENTTHGCRECFMYGLKGGRTDLTLLGEFVTSNSGSDLLTKGIVKNTDKVTLKCECGERFETTPNKVKERLQFRCRFCSGDMSNMEYTTKNILDDMGVEYVQEYTSDKLRTPSGGNARFDFAVIQDNLITNFIELDGIQHYEPVDFFGGKEALSKTKERDDWKTRYCIKENINLIRIPYTKKNEINKILKERLVK